VIRPFAPTAQPAPSARPKINVVDDRSKPMVNVDVVR
jgi:hypothetical protein